MSLTEILTEHAAKATVGGLVAGFLAGAVMVMRRGATNAQALAMLEREIAHRDELRKAENKSVDDRFAALTSRVEATESKVEISKDLIMAKLDSMEIKR